MSVPPFLHPFAKPAAQASEFINIVRGEGAAIFDDQGNRYVDGMASLWYCQVGHGRQEIADAVHKQMSTLAVYNTFDRFTNGPVDDLAMELVALAPMANSRVFFTQGGSEAVDTAFKIARVAQVQAGHPERTVIISRVQSYHGVNFGGLAATGLPLNQAGFGTMLADVVQVPQHDLDAMGAACAQYAGRIAAIISEPVQGAGGVHPSAPGYLQGLRALADQHGAFLIIDEVICGFGRLGTWWGSQHYGIVPDLVTFAKGVSSGYTPVGGVLVGTAVREPLEADPNFLLRHGYTYTGHPSACVGALANLAIIKREGLVERAKHVGDRLSAGLHALLAAGRVTAVRGEGAVWAVSLPEGMNPVAVRETMLTHGAIARPIPSSTIAFCPPLMTPDSDIDILLHALGQGLTANS
jgi:putrescine---pyruvate transaminase